jgi:hypothetical protein
MVAIALVATIILGAWTYLVVSYDSPLGTDNIVVVNQSGSTSNESDDLLATLSFDEGAEDLEWSSLTIEIEANEQLYTCSLGSQSVESDSESKVKSRLSSDGVTFSNTIDATSEDEFTYFSIPMQKESNQSNFTLRASKTDLFFSEGVQWAFIPEKGIQQVTSFNESQLSNQTSDRIEWYTYDLSAHRVTPNDGTYVILQDDVLYKAQILTYYNDKDESRHITVLTSALIPEDHPALQDSTIVVPSPCLVEPSGDATKWNATESISLREQDINICGQDCNLNLRIKYETVQVKVEYTS